MITALMASMLLSGCASSGNVTGASFSSGSGGATVQLYVSTPNSILHFSSSERSGGDIAPAGIISGADTQLSTPRHLLMDPPNDRLYVANQGGSSVLVFDKVSTLNGDVAPTRVIVGSATLLITPTDAALDSAKDLIYVADGAFIQVFAAASTIVGNVTPVRTINIGFGMGSLFLDAVNDQLYVSDPGGNVVDRLDGASSQSGNAVVSAAISGPDTTLAHPEGLALDIAGRLVVGNSGTPPAVGVFANAATASGDVAPVAEITGSNTLLQSPGQIALDRNTADSDLFVLDVLTGSILVFQDIAIAEGNISPTTSISGPNTGMAPNGVSGLALDPTR